MTDIEWRHPAIDAWLQLAVELYFADDDEKRGIRQGMASLEKRHPAEIGKIKEQLSVALSEQARER